LSGEINLALHGFQFTASSRSRPGQLERILANLFFLFFCAQILSPQISGTTIYLELPISLVNVYYLKWLSRIKISTRAVAFAILFLGLTFAISPEALIRCLSIANSAAFLAYAYERRIFYLFRFMSLAILIGIAQFVLAQIDPHLARLIGPTSISNFFWGENSIGGRTNFYTIFWFDRVSGLSRESGFFAALLSAVTLFAIVDKKILTKKWASLLLSGNFISLSKISLSILPNFLLYKYRHSLNRIPPEISFPISVAFLSLVVTYLIASGIGLGGETFVHRFSGYYRFVQISLPELLFGAGDIRSQSWVELDELNGKFAQLAGFGGFILNYGLVLVIAWYALLRSLGAGTVAFLIILVGTANVNPLTNQNFVVLYYFLTIYLIPQADTSKHLSTWTPENKFASVSKSG